MNPKTSNELRCFCSRKPLLATYGLDKNGRIYVHVRVFKQRRVFGEVLVTEGKVQLHCRECLRWHTVRIKQTGTVQLEEDSEAPAVIEPVDAPMLAASGNEA